MDPVLSPKDIGITLDDIYAWAQDIKLPDIADDHAAEVAIRGKITAELGSRKLLSAKVRRAGGLRDLVDIVYDSMMGYRA